ncbi:MAG: Release factor glutamine methyltransferase, partial [Pseudomonadota bacterium]
MQTEPTTVRQALDAARRRLAGLPDADPALDAEVLLAHVLERSRSWLYAWPDRALSPAELRRFDALLGKRASGVPVAHLTGRREFWSLDLEVSPETLIPRPDTELLVEWALACLPPQPPARVLELGTGSGAIALALARERPTWQITASDCSPAALAVARRNAQRLRIAGVQFLAGDW